jgi:hypothetical protein
MRLSLTKLENITRTIITIHLMSSPLCLLLQVRLGDYIVNLCDFSFYNLIGKLTVFCCSFSSSACTIKRWTLPHHTTVSSQLKSKIGDILAKAAALRIILSIDGVPVESRSHTHPSHSQTSRLLTSSLSSGVPVPRTTQCM